MTLKYEFDEQENERCFITSFINQTFSLMFQAWADFDRFNFLVKFELIVLID